MKEVIELPSFGIIMSSNILDLLECFYKTKPNMLINSMSIGLSHDLFLLAYDKFNEVYNSIPLRNTKMINNKTIYYKGIRLTESNSEGFESLYCNDELIAKYTY